MMLRPVCEPHGREGFGRTLPGSCVGCAIAAVEQRQLHVLQRRRPRQRIEALKDEPDIPDSNGGDLIVAEPGVIAALEKIWPAGGLIKAAQDVYQGGLTGTGRA